MAHDKNNDNNFQIPGVWNIQKSYLKGLCYKDLQGNPKPPSFPRPDQTEHIFKEYFWVGLVRVGVFLTRV